MREIKFRAKRADTGAWVYGDLQHVQRINTKEQAEQRERFEAMIELCEKNPKHRCMAALRMAYENKTLQSLGISWKPSDAGESK